MMKNLLKNVTLRSIRNALMLTFFSFSLHSLYAQEISWTLQSPSPAANSHNDVAWVNDETIYLSGAKGQFLKSFDFGQNWEVYTIPTNAAVNAIYFLDELKGYAATDGGEIFLTSDGGENWELQFTDPAGATLRAIHFYDAQTGYAAGDAGFAENLLFRTSDGGLNWEAAALPITPGAAFYGLFYVKAINADTVFSAGWDNSFFYSYDAGLSWETSTLPASAGGFYEGGYFVNDSTGFVVGPKAGVAKTIDYGHNWELIAGSADSTVQDKHYFTEVFFLNNEEGWVSSFGCLYKTTNGGEDWASSCEGTYGTFRKSNIIFNSEGRGIAVAAMEVYTTSDGEAFEKILPVDATNNWTSIDEADGELFVSGSGGAIFHSNNEGMDWHLINTPVTSVLRGISFLDKDNGWVTGDGGTILKTNDGGASWESMPTAYDGAFNSLHAWSSTSVIVAGNGGNIFKTTNGGTDWTKGEISTEKHINAIHFPGEEIGYAAGRTGLMARSNDGGLSWTILDPGVLSHLNDVYFTDENTGYAVGNSGVILYTNDAGSTWVPQVSGQSSALNSVFFYDQDHGWVSGRGFVLVTRDGGQNWEEQNTASANALNAIYFMAPDKGWAVGSVGNVLYYGVEESPQEPEPTSLQADFPAENSALKLYPNPASRHITISMPANYEGRGKLELYSLAGRLLHTGDLLFGSGQGQWIVPPVLDNGLYSFRIIVEKKSLNGRILISK